MSFDLTPPSRNLSNVQASAKSCAGGGGNTGYFRRDGGNSEEDSLGFAKDYGDDTFEYSDCEEEPTPTFSAIFIRFLSNLVRKIKRFFKR